MTRKITKRTDDEKRTLLKKAEELMAAGMNKSEAAKECGIAHSQIYEWKKRYQGDIVVYNNDNPARKAYTKKPKPKNLMLVLGNPQEIAEFYRSINE